MPKFRTDITPEHHPHEYELVSYNTDAFGKEKVIHIGTRQQCFDRLQEVGKFDLDYATKCSIRKA